jgi:hypothetical protein
MGSMYATLGESFQMTNGTRSLESAGKHWSTPRGTLIVGVAEAMADMATVAVVAAEEAVDVAVADEDMVAAAVAKTIIIIIMIEMSMKPRRVTVRRHLLVEMGTMFLRA